MTLLPTVNVLLVDDHPENLIALEAILGELGQNLVCANSGEEALRCLLHQDFAVILLDVQMPGLDGFETASLIRQRQRSRNTPIIFLTAFSTSDDLMVKGYSLGAVDYLFKPLNPAILLSKVTVFVELFQKTAEVERQAAQLAQINAELKRSEERFRLLSRCSPVGIFLMDTAGRYTYANPSCHTICGFALQEDWQTNWTHCIYAQDREQVLANWASCIQQGQSYSGEFRVQVPDLKWVHVRSSPMRSEQGELLGHVGTLEDITDRQQAEATQAQMIREQTARQQAEAANRMKDEFLAIVSHELRTPLNSILGWAQLLLNRKLDGATTTRALETIERNARSQTQLIEDILDVSQIIQGKLRLAMQPVNIAALIESVIDTVRLSANSKSLQIETDYAAKIGKVYGDAERLKQIIWNLLSNSIKFTPEQGRITICITHLSKNRHDQVKHQHKLGLSVLAESDPGPAVQLSGDYAQIRISDTGIGISASFLPHVFDRFRQADSTTTRPYGGLGLGLAIVHHLVEQHRGTIWVESAGEGQGTTFTVNLPLLTQPETQLPDQTAGQAQSFSLDQIQVLVVEDHSDTRDFITMVLQESGAEVVAVASVHEAVQYLERVTPDVLVSDIGLPLEDGYALLRKVRDREQQGQQIPAIALTAYARDEDQNQALEAGFHQHVTKPFAPEELIAAVASAVRG
ncbi:MAG: response regulator [Nodosilinea sp.]